MHNTEKNKPLPTSNTQYPCQQPHNQRQNKLTTIKTNKIKYKLFKCIIFCINTTGCNPRALGIFCCFCIIFCIGDIILKAKVNYIHTNPPYTTFPLPINLQDAKTPYQITKSPHVNKNIPTFHRELVTCCIRIKIINQNYAKQTMKIVALLLVVLCATMALGENVIVGTADNFEELVEDGHVLVEFYAPWYVWRVFGSFCWFCFCWFFLFFGCFCCGVFVCDVWRVLVVFVVMYLFGFLCFGCVCDVFVMFG